jgi:hypothetical protein
MLTLEWIRSRASTRPLDAPEHVNPNADRLATQAIDMI